jgi:twitching motility protein PilT
MIDPKYDYGMKPIIDRFLLELLERGGSDLHIKANAPIYGRIHGEIVRLSKEIFPKDAALKFAKEFTRGRFEELVKNKDIDLVYVLNDDYRFRINIFFQLDGVSAVFRAIPTKILSIDELGLPPGIKKITELKRGLVLVTGITGSGKSTTMAAIIDEINKKRAEHIITIEDPVEFVYKNKKSIINQRSLGHDALSYSRALRAALREDPDVIVVGEMRDLETIEMALHAAETGHLVISTLHTLNAKETINRIISVFPSEEQNQIRHMLASVLEAIVSQRLVKSKDGGRRAAVELLFATDRIKSMILEKRENEISEALAEGSIYGMQTFDQSLLELYKQGEIDKEEALRNATSRSDLELQIKQYHTQNSSDDSGPEVIDLKL